MQKFGFSEELGGKLAGVMIEHMCAYEPNHPNKNKTDN